MNDADRLRAIQRAPNLYPALDHHLGEIIGHKLFTLMVIDRAANEAARLYSSNPQSYPVKGRKPLGDLSRWGDHVLGKGLPYIGSSADDIRSVFPDHKIIASLGCESVLNVPVMTGGLVIGTINLLHEAGWYQPEHAERCAPFAALLEQRFLAWTSS